MDTWSSDDVDVIDRLREPLMSKIVDQFPLEKVSETIENAFGKEIPGDLESDNQGRLLNRYLRYTGNATSDVVEGYNRMLISISKSISTTRVNLGNGVFMGFTEPTFIPPNNKHTPLYCRQHDITYALAIRTDAYKIIPVYDNNNVIVSYKIATNAAGNNLFYSFNIGEIPLMVGSMYCITVRERMTSQQLYDIGECADDPRGYFIIDGSEYLLIISDKLRTNVSICTFKKGEYKIKMTCDDYIGSTMNVSIRKDEHNIYKIPLKLLQVKDSSNIIDVNVLTIFRTLGYQFYVANKTLSETLKAIESTILIFVKPAWRNTVLNELLSTFGNLDSNNNDFETFAIIKSEAYTKDLPSIYLEKLQQELFYHYKYEGNSTETINYLKCYNLGMMIAKLALTATGLIKPDERDSWSLKRLVTAGPKMYQLFSYEWRSFIQKIYEWIRTKHNGVYTNGPIENPINNSKESMKIKDIFVSSFKTLWGNHKGNKNEKITDILKRESKIAPWAYINRIKTPGSQENNKTGARNPHMTQFGYIDPVDTPEGKDGCGIIKNKSITCWISTGADEILILQALEYFGKAGVYSISYNENYAIFILNGKLFGFCIGEVVHKELINQRRNGALPKDTLIVFDTDSNIVYVYTDGGRPTRPLLIVNQETGNLIIDEKNMWDANIEELLSNGCMEYIDAFEQEFIYISPNVSALKRRHENIVDLEKIVMELNASRQLFLETGNIKFSILDKERIERQQTLKELKDKIDALNRLQEHDGEELQKIFKDFKEISTKMKDGELTREALRYKFIDINYIFKRLTVNVRKRKEEINKYKYKYKALEEASLNADIINADYFENELDIALRNLEKLRQVKVYSHCELHPGAIYSISASLIPSLNKNPAPRGGFQCNMGRAALGIYHSNFQERFDTTSKILANPNAPVVEAQLTRLLGLERYGHGENIIMAIMSYEFNQEDAIILNSSSVQRGLLRSLIQKKVEVSFNTNKNRINDVIETESKTMTPYSGEDEDKVIDLYRYRHLDVNGIAKVESVLHEGDCIIGIQKTISIGGRIEKINKSKFVDKEYEGYVVDRFSESHRNGETVIKVILRNYRFPIAGDKFASRIAQKSTVGLLVPVEDLPTDEYGMTPDIIINPNAFPSRGTISHLLEMLVGKAAVLSGWNVNLATSKEISIEKFLGILRSHGYNQWGYQRLLNGKTGQFFKGEIYIGPIYYQALKHQVDDKIQARQRGKRDQLTHEAVRGKKRGGGGKFGEMEKDSIVSHGAAGILNDTHCVSSNAFTCVICTKCHRFFDVKFDLGDKKFKCKICDDESEIARATKTYSTVGLAGILAIMDINMEFITKSKK